MTKFGLAPSVEVRPGSTCPCCGLVLTGAGGVVPQAEAGVPSTPSPGDFTVCISCGEVLAFDERLNIRKLTDSEKRTVSDDDRILLVKNAIHQLRRRKLTPNP